MTAYTALTAYGASGASPSPEFIQPGDYLTSPNGLYYGILTDSQFVVSRGSDPAMSGLNSVWSTPKNSQAGPVNVADFVAGQFGIFSASNNVIYTTPSGGYGKSNSFAAVQDTGAFIINLGTFDNPGQQIFNNGINDPLKNYTVSQINYNLKAATITAAAISSGSSGDKGSNQTPMEQTCSVSLSLSYTKSQTWDWNLSQSLTLGLTSTTTVGIPDVAS